MQQQSQFLSLASQTPCEAPDLVALDDDALAQVVGGIAIGPGGNWADHTTGPGNTW